MKIESIDQEIRTMLGAAYYKIPRFQRPYSWEDDHVQDFWDDVIRDNPVDYFIGSMVVYKDGKQRYGIVDGQQRLTTITVLLCVLRDTLESLDHSDLAKGIHQLIARRNIDNKHEFVLTTETSFPYFQEHIQKFGEPTLDIPLQSEEILLEKAQSKLQGLVSSVVTSVREDASLSAGKKKKLILKKLIDIRDSILNLNIILVTLDNADDAYLIFETLNTRGKDLALSDLVKNHISRHNKSKGPSPDAIKLKWQKLMETIEESAVEIKADTFIHHFWLSKYEYLPAKSLFKTLKKKITASATMNLLDNLVSDAALYRAAFETDYIKWKKEELRIRDALDALNLFKVQQQTPWILSVLREYKTTKKLKLKHVQDALVAVEKFHFFFTATTSQRSSGGISQMYASLARRLAESKDTEAAAKLIQELKTKMRERIPGLAQVIALFPYIYYTSLFSKQKRLVKYILVALHKENLSGVTIDYHNMTIEHLLSQSHAGSKGTDHLSIGELGNLLLVSKELNEKLKNKPFPEKKQILIDSGYKLDPEILAAVDWTQTDIDARTERMATLAYNSVWKF